MAQRNASVIAADLVVEALTNPIILSNPITWPGFFLFAMSTFTGYYAFRNHYGEPYKIHVLGRFQDDDDVMRWIESPDRKGRYTFRLGATDTGQFLTTFYVTDPDTAFEMRLRFGAPKI